MLGLDLLFKHILQSFYGNILMFVRYKYYYF